MAISTFEKAAKLFEFKVGDLVYPRQAFAQWLTNTGGGRLGTADLNQPYVVVERLLVECHGGVQATYHIRNWASSERQVIALSVLEVVSWETVSEAYAAARAAKKNDSPWDAMPYLSMLGDYRSLLGAASDEG